MAMRLSALRIDRALLRRNIFLLLVLIFVNGRIYPRAAGRIRQAERIIPLIVSRTRKLRAMYNSASTIDATVCPQDWLSLHKLFKMTASVV
jgi:hypothetical protein